MTAQRLVIATVGLVTLAAVIIIGVLALRGAGIPDVLQNVAVGGLTGLIGLLVPTTPSRPRQQP